MTQSLYEKQSLAYLGIILFVPRWNEFNFAHRRMTLYGLWEVLCICPHMSTLIDITLAEGRSPTNTNFQGTV